MVKGGCEGVHPALVGILDGEAWSERSWRYAGVGKDQLPR